jgi:membrane protease YdiL (CAAX protease family)
VARFALLHHRYGNLSPENALAGLLLGWAYLRSGSLALPILLHSVGNALVFLAVYFVMPLLL